MCDIEQCLYYVLSTCMLVKIDLDIAISTTETLDLSQVLLGLT